MTRSQKALLFSVALIAAAAMAQDQDAPEAGQQPAEPLAQAQEQEQQQNAAETADDRPLTGNSGSRFEPSEEVSEDLSISFPADI